MAIGGSWLAVVFGEIVAAVEAGYSKITRRWSRRTELTGRPYLCPRKLLIIRALGGHLIGFEYHYTELGYGNEGLGRMVVVYSYAHWLASSITTRVWDYS